MSGVYRHVDLQAHHREFCPNRFAGNKDSAHASVMRVPFNSRCSTYGSLEMPSTSRSETLGAPVKRASTRVKAPPAQSDGSAPQTVAVG